MFELALVFVAGVVVGYVGMAWRVSRKTKQPLMAVVFGGGGPDPTPPK